MEGSKRGGRAPGQRNRRTEALMALAQDGESPAALCLRISRDGEQPLDVRMQAAKIAAPYVHSKPQPEPRIVSFDMPEAFSGAASLLTVHAALLRATAVGELALDDAKDLSAMLETHRRIVETVELEERITALEKAAR